LNCKIVWFKNSLFEKATIASTPSTILAKVVPLYPQVTVEETVIPVFGVKAGVQLNSVSSNTPSLSSSKSTRLLTPSLSVSKQAFKLFDKVTY
jgi:hypothetical protein